MIPETISLIVRMFIAKFGPLGMGAAFTGPFAAAKAVKKITKKITFSIAEQKERNSFVRTFPK